MPELPEVETMVRGIRPHIAGRMIRDVIECETLCKPLQIQPRFDELKSQLVGQRFTRVSRIGKRIVLEVGSQGCLVIEPRMTGLLVLQDPPDAGHLRIQWLLDDEGSYNSFWFWDRRGLGTVTLMDPGDLRRRLGPPVLGPDALEMTAAKWYERCRDSSRPIKLVLLDQKAVAGIGNLYASEILHVAGVDPSSSAGSLSRKTLGKLSEAVQMVLLKAIECEGSTLSDGTYRNALNKNGRYQNHHRVYMRAGQSCPTCAIGTIVRIVQAQRSTFYCPKCQKGKKG